MEEKEKYRLVTRSNFDGIISAALLKKLDMVEEILYVHPQDVQDGIVKVDEHDIVTNLPYVEGVHMAFDHMLDIHDKQIKLNAYHALFTDAGSVSEVIYEYYGGAEAFPDEVLPMIAAANRSKSARYTKEDILSPGGWDLLAFLTDPRTGLGRYKEYRISNYALMQELPDLCLQYDIDGILESPDVKERVERYDASREQFVTQLQRCVEIEGDVAVIDLRNEETIYPGNRFMIYALYPDVSASVHIFRGRDDRNTVFALGKSILNRSNEKDIYEIVSRYGGGGHKDVGTCQVDHKDAERVREEIIALLAAAR
ncbi:MAG: exopolyphosphatase [Campylobacteraceae bacterium 4484_4]|nr:MAG: exopolyphosphatase [Campylobacteraceae bacterium 4484_4]